MGAFWKRKKKSEWSNCNNLEVLGGRVSRFKHWRSKCKWVDSSRGVKCIFPYVERQEEYMSIIFIYSLEPQINQTL
jgi:hypothetical protein